MSATNRKRNRGDAAKLEMTPMIDVVFQLLIFFIVTLRQEDILSYLSISRPTNEATEPKPQIQLLTIEVGRSAWTVNGRMFTGRQGLEAMDKKLTHIASYSKEASVIIKCAKDSPHSGLVKVLNICTREGMQNLSVFSM